MADILIRGLSIPKEGFINLSVQSEGLTMLTGTSAFNEKTGWFEWQKCDHTMHETIELPEHGDLIDISNAENALFVAGNYHLNDYKQGWNDGIEAVIENAPVIVPSNKEDTE